jgi:peptidoglycan hydrolase-like protein with peptidoglycan-binding domain
MVSTVQDVQNALNTLGYGPLAVDGVAGPLTKAATTKFQDEHSLSADGIAGPQTKAALTAALANAGNAQAQSMIAQDNSSPPTNLTAAHIAPTAGSPALTVITDVLKGTQRNAPFGTPSSPISVLAKTTGATPAAKQSIAQKAETLTTTEKVGIGVVLAAGLTWLGLRKGKK